MLKTWTLGAVVGGILVAFAGHAADSPFVYDGRDHVFHDQNREFDEPAPWRESQSSLPPYPKDADLIELPEGSRPDRFTYFIDRAHFAVGEDKVVHYTIVAESGSGARNVYFEGLRCDVAQYKVYGYGTSDGKVSALKNPQWRPIPAAGAQRYRGDLFRYFLCDNYGDPVNAARAMEHFETGKTSAETRDFLGGDKSGW